MEAGERGQMQRGGVCMYLVCEKAEGCVTAGPDVPFGIEAQWLYPITGCHFELLVLICILHKLHEPRHILCELSQQRTQVDRIG